MSISDELASTKLASLKMRLNRQYIDDLAEYARRKPSNYEGYDWTDNCPVFSQVPVPPPPVAPYWSKHE